MCVSIALATIMLLTIGPTIILSDFSCVNLGQRNNVPGVGFHPPFFPIADHIGPKP